MLIRVPLPVKLLLSYLLVVAAGAVPTLVYLRAELVRQLQEEAAADLAREAQVIARSIAELPLPEQKERARFYASLLDLRISLILESGEVLLDTHVPNPMVLASHAERPEVRAALSEKPKASSEPPQETVGVRSNGDGLGVARRVSVTTGVDTLYVAAKVPTGKEPVEVLRLALPMARTEALVGETVTVLRNAQAVAISIALGLSLLAAILFVRPLRRIKDAAEALASGDFARHVGELADDEVGDVGRAIERLGAELRRRMAVAGAGEALLVQLVDVVPTPLVVFELDGEVVALNGAARRLFQVEDPSAGRRLRALLEDSSFRGALKRAEDEGDAVRVALPMGEAPGFVHVLKRPGTAPLALLLVPPKGSADPSLLPRARDILARPLDEVISDARARALPVLQEGGLVLDAPESVPSLLVSDAGDRLPRALALVLEGCLPWFAGRTGSLSLDVDVEETRVGVSFDAVPAGDPVAAARPLLEPLGGSIETTSSEVTVWLPRA